ncbi:histidine phosphatase family protein [Agrobacterium sp. RS6]|uniref:histidine phosphatase family protein n=1 Tax=Agrobacterium sp. RS6 TaxID=2489001 RepID=UPI001FDF42C1|nr:histidine phosphatase family protein [Agrobacterium sp. RS6]
MKNIFVVTHTQSVHHVENKVGGWYDTELTPKGKADAQATAEKLVALIGNASVEIFSSDLLRASQTAAIIAEHLKSPFETTDGLREISYGSAGGMPQEWLDARQIPAPHHDRMDHRGGIADGETRRELAERVYRAVEHDYIASLPHADHRYPWLRSYLRHRGMDQNADRQRRLCQLSGVFRQHYAPKTRRLLAKPRRYRFGGCVPPEDKPGDDVERGTLSDPLPQPFNVQPR